MLKQGTKIRTNSFQENEILGRRKSEKVLKDLPFTFIRDTKDLYSPFDQIWIDENGVTVVVEIKVRSVNKDTYRTTILEAKKYRTIKKIATEYKCRIFYLNFFNDGFKLFEVTDLSNHSTRYMNCPKTTSSNDGTIIQKEVFELDSTVVIHSK